MGLKSDHWIRKMSDRSRMIHPFEGGSIRHKQSGPVVSYGTSSYGYDLRCASDFKICTNAFPHVIDPKSFDDEGFVDHQGDTCLIPPQGFVLARSLEYIRMPKNVMALCVGKTTYTRCGLLFNVTPLEPEWEGFVSFELTNVMPHPIKIYANEGIAQLLFFEGDEVPSATYADKRGRYQHQQRIEAPKV